ncbi:MAG: undecaprenyl/decaprenyl-phosphate alpha-N-acetylglucosaminyl 1-phosphate transferase, partial [Candidatus Cloacimonetes bacterium]|nr:undecaprenyl/decaprenyl-phosphate alpha-N-acetylglucosaminyl 1-phosphate transferase [Candidatus Cloacimonadota bacterium]
MNIIYVCMTVFILSFLVVYSITPLIIRFALRVNFVDNPNARKIHKKAIPLLGGISVFIGFLLLLLYTIITKQRVLDLPILGYITGAIIIVLVGVIDDKFGMPPIVKLIGQLASVSVFILTHDLFTLFGPIYITIPLIVLWMVGLMNALNFLDNMDGIITGMSGILALGFYAIGFLSKTPELANQADFISILSL